MLWIYLVQGLTLGLSAAASPGPFQAFIIGQSIKNGWKRTLPACLAPLLTDGPIIALALILLANLPHELLRAVRIVGGFFILYLAYQAFQGFRRFREEQCEPTGGVRQSLGQAAVMNFLSPGPYIFWSLLGGPILLTGWRQAPANGLSFMAGFYLAMVGSLVLFILLFGTARHLGPRVSRALLGLSALAMLGFGAYQLWQGIVV
jgi:threonine/homoserine/homoserine lactone efflux protein